MELYQLSSTARRMFDVEADPARIAASLLDDPQLGPLAARRPGLRIPGAWDPFECGVRAILGQQISVAAARTLAMRLVMRLGRPTGSDADGLTHLFPSANAVAVADLNDMGLTERCRESLRSLGRAVRDGSVNFSDPVEEVLRALADLPGVGNWTAQYVALRALGEPDAFPSGDLVLRQAASVNCTPLTSSELEIRAEAWRPWRGYAVIHLWQARRDMLLENRADQVRKRPVTVRRWA
jgi:AraC family transcriptional regulator of adaptative response / DNA-3-methyladenine glycosylase II